MSEPYTTEWNVTLQLTEAEADAFKAHPEVFVRELNEAFRKLYDDTLRDLFLFGSPDNPESR